jgi:branched-chain amino acid transport system ATP-binding protein
MEPILDIRSVAVGYSKKEILHNASLDIMPGEIVALLGANGSGKSTLLKTVMGLLRPTKGKMFFNGQDITGMPTHRIVSLGISFLMQTNCTFSNFTIYENMISVNIKEKSILDQRINEILTLFPQLRNKLNRRAGLLSGGERQQLALAMVLMKKPKLLLLDEPSDGLSPNNVENIFNMISDIIKTQNVSIILVEQNLSEALKIANRVCIMKDGSVFAKEHPEELLSNEKIEEILF